MSQVGPSPRSVRVDLRDHVKERQSARRRLLAFRVLGLLAVVGAVAGIIWAVFYSSLFAMKMDSLVIEGAQSDVAAADVEPAVAKYEGVPLPQSAGGFHTG